MGPLVVLLSDLSAAPWIGIRAARDELALSYAARATVFRRSLTFTLS
jgi:hypothetical protein